MGDNAIESIIPSLDMNKKELDEITVEILYTKIDLVNGYHYRLCCIYLDIMQPWKGSFELLSSFCLLQKL